MLIIVRVLISVKVIAWIILRFTTNIPHPISEIEVYLVLMLVDVWGLGGQITEIHVKKED